MRRGELARLFPDARIVGERFGGVIKSSGRSRGLPTAA